MFPLLILFLAILVAVEPASVPVDDELETPAEDPAAAKLEFMLASWLVMLSIVNVVLRVLLLEELGI